MRKETWLQLEVNAKPVGSHKNLLQLGSNAVDKKDLGHMPHATSGFLHAAFDLRMNFKKTHFLKILCSYQIC